jgi:hypothetical protein
MVTPLGGSPAIVPTGVIVLGYAFDEGVGLNSADSSGDSSAGTLLNGPSWTEVKNGIGLQFDGVNDYLTAPNSTSLNITGNSLSVSAWVFPTSTSGTRVIAGKPFSATYSTSI